jgi:hypothetical protein
MHTVLRFRLTVPNHEIRRVRKLDQCALHRSKYGIVQPGKFPYTSVSFIERQEHTYISFLLITFESVNQFS